MKCQTHFPQQYEQGYHPCVIRDFEAEVNFKEEFVWGSNGWGWISLINGQRRLLSLLCVIGVTVPSLGDKTEKKTVRYPTGAVRRSWPSSAPVSLQQGATASPALWCCGVGAGGCPVFWAPAVPSVCLWQCCTAVADESHLLRSQAGSSPTRRPKLAAPDLQSSQDSLFRTSAISENITL